MLILLSTDKIQVINTPTGTISTHASYVDYDTTTPTVSTPGRKNLAITTAATNDVVLSPGGATIFRTVKTLNVRNTNAASVTITVQHTDGTTVVELIKCTLLTNEELVCREGVWFRYDANGGVYSTPSQGINPLINGFRLTGVTATPIMTADSTTLSTVYMTPYRGSQIALYDGTNWQLLASAEVSIAVSGRTTDLPFDVFAANVAGVLTLEVLNWTSATARATGLTRQDGVWTKTGDATRRYVGSVRARSATTYHWVMAGTDLPAKFDLFNMDNRSDFSFVLKASTATWAYTLTTIRQAQASTNYQVDVMVGVQEEQFTATLIVNSTNSTISIGRSVGIGFDSTTAFSGGSASIINTVASIMSAQVGFLSNQPTIGRHFYAWNESSVATGTATWTGASATAGFNLQSGMVGTWTC